MTWRDWLGLFILLVVVIDTIHSRIKRGKHTKVKLPPIPFDDLDDITIEDRRQE